MRYQPSLSHGILTITHPGKYHDPHLIDKRIGPEKLLLEIARIGRVRFVWLQICLMSTDLTTGTWKQRSLTNSTKK